MSDRRRDPHEVLARARILSLLSIVEDGMYPEMIPSFVEGYGLARWLTDQERAWFAGEAELDVVDGYQVEAMLVMTWALGLIDALGDRDPLAYGPVLNLLQGFERVQPEAALAPRPAPPLRAMLAELDAIAARGDGQPPHERFGEPALRWRRAALRWLLDPDLPWPAG